MYKKTYSKRKRSIGRYRSRKRYRRYSTNRKIPPGKAYGTLVNRSNGVMPATFITRHTYNTPISFVIGAGVTNNHIYRGNGLNDPDQSGTGTTATGMTFLSTAYTYNRVYASAVEYTVANTGDFPIIFFVVPTRTATVLNLQSAKSYPYYKEIIVAEQSGGLSVKTIKHFCKTSTLMDVTTRDFDLQAAAGANPTQQWYWICGVLAMDGATASSCTVSTRITYFTQWNGLKAMAT